MKNLFSPPRNNKRILDRYFSSLYFLSVFLVHIPYYYLIPTHFIFFNSYFLSRLITLFIFIYITLSSECQKILTTLKTDSFLKILILLLFAQTLSVFRAYDIFLFLQT